MISQDNQDQGRIQHNMVTLTLNRLECISAGNDVTKKNMSIQIISGGFCCLVWHIEHKCYETLKKMCPILNYTI